MENSELFWDDLGDNDQVSHTREITLKDICSHYSCELNEIDKLIQARADRISDRCQKSSAIDSSLIDDFDFIYQVYLATRKDDSGLSSSLDNFHSFRLTYLKNMDDRGLKAFFGHMKRFNSMVIHPYGIVGSREAQRGLVDMSERKWISVSSSRNDSDSKFIDERIVSEVHELIDSNIQMPQAYHSTASGALPGIERHGAILASRERSRLNETFETGEVVTMRTSDQLENGKLVGLKNVYVSDSMKTGYGVQRWFDEFDIVFGFDWDDLSNNLTINPTEDDRHVGPGEGSRVGSRVPLGLVKIIFADIMYLDQVKKWAKKTLPELRWCLLSLMISKEIKIGVNLS